MAELLMEEVGRALLLIVKGNVVDAIDDVWSEMETEDTVFYAALGESVPVTPKQYPSRYYLGHHPSILDRPVIDYPNVTVVSYRSRSIGDLAADQYEVVGHEAYVEAFVVHEDESTVNRMALRYAKALNRVVDQHRDLDEVTIEPIFITPDAAISNAAARRVDQFSESIV